MYPFTDKILSLISYLNFSQVFSSDFAAQNTYRRNSRLTVNSLKTAKFWKFCHIKSTPQPTYTRFHYILWGNKRCTLHGLANVMVMSDSQLTKVLLILRVTLKQEYITEPNNYSDIPKHGWVDAFLTYTTLRKNSADDKLMIFFLFFPVAVSC